MIPELPPYAAMLGISAEADGTLSMPFSDAVLGRPGFLHGGAIAGLMEMALHKALIEALGEEGAATVIKPVNMTVTYMRGGREMMTYARATVERLGTRVANVEVHAWQDDPSSPIASASCNFLKG